MKHAPECVPCLMGRVLFQSYLPNNGKERESVEAALKTYAKVISEEPNSARMAAFVHKSSYDALGVSDPYLELKVRADEVALKYYDRVVDFIEGSDDRFKAAVKVAIMGNIMDFGAGIAIEDPEEFDDHFESLLEMELTIDDTRRIRDEAERADTVVYIFDNCGESVFDILLIEQIRAMGKRVVGVVRGEPILNDVTTEDALRVGLDKHLDAIMTTNSFSIGVDMEKIDDLLRNEIDNAGLIIAKGMANFESLGEEDLPTPIAYLLKTKCRPVASEFNVEIGSNVAKLIP